MNASGLSLRGILLTFFANDVTPSAPGELQKSKQCKQASHTGLWLRRSSHCRLFGVVMPILQNKTASIYKAEMKE